MPGLVRYAFAKREINTFLMKAIRITIEEHMHTHTHTRTHAHNAFISLGIYTLKYHSVLKENTVADTAHVDWVLSLSIEWF